MNTHFLMISFKNNPLNTTLIHGACVNEIIRIMVITCSTYFQSQKTLTIACIIMPAEYLCCQYINSLRCATWLAGSRGGRTGPAGSVLAGPLFWHPGPTTHEHCKASFVYHIAV